MLYYGMTEEELLEIEEAKGWECLSEEGDVAFVNSFENDGGTVEVRICAEGDVDSGCSWNVWITDDSNDWTFTKWSVPEAVAFAEKYVADMS